MGSARKRHISESSGTGDEIRVVPRGTLSRSSLTPRPQQQQPQRKRSRTSLARSHGGATFSDDDDEQPNLQPTTRQTLAQHDSASPASSPEPETIASRFGSVAPDALSSRYDSVMPDDIEYNSEDDDAEADEELGTRYMRRHLGQLKENVAQSNGIIEEVVCTNFMCHAKLRITLGPLINFICGHNGSGKSAVLTALTICLGNKAASTNRGSSLKDMIKEGQDYAVLQVKIKNQGEGAYRPDQYGRSIIVERHLSRTSAPSFKLKSAEGKIISTKKRDLDDMLDYYSLQLDNPINVLTQDNARVFLANSTAAEKYKLFIKGTLLELLDNDYKTIEAGLDDLTARLTSVDDDIVVLRAKKDEAEKRRQQMRQNDNIRTMVRETQHMHAWAQVEGQERHLEACVANVVEAESKVRDAEATAESASGAYEGRNQSFETEKRMMGIKEQELEPLFSELNGFKEEFESGRLRLTELQTSMRNAKQDYRAAQNRKKELEDQIRHETRVLAETQGTLHLQRLDRLQELEESAKRAKDERIRLESLRMDFEVDARDTAEKAKEILGRVAARRTALEATRATLNKLQRDQNQRFAAYPANMSRLVQAIDMETRWRGKPVGPLGHCLQVKQARWQPLLERTFAGMLNSFVVTNREDQSLLRQIQDRIGFHSPVYITTTAQLDMTGKEPGSDIDTVLRMFSISDNLVRNVLIIQSSAEQTALILDRQTAHDYMYRDQRPANIKTTITFSDAKIHGMRFDYSRSNLPKVGPVEAWRGPSRFRVDRAEELRRQEQRVDQAQDELDSILREQRQLDQVAQKAKEASENNKRSRHAAMRHEHETQDVVDGAKEEIEQNRPRDGRLQELQRQLNAQAEEENGQRSIVEDLAHSKGTLDGKQLEIKRRMDACDDRVNSHKRELERAREDFSEADEKRNLALREKNRALEHVKYCKTQVEKAIELRDHERKSLEDDFIRQAEQICARVPVEAGVTPQILDARLERFQKDLERAQRQAGGTLEELTDAFMAAKQKYDNLVSSVNRLQRTGRHAQASLNNRRKRWKLFRKYITLRARIQFKYLLSERGFRGNLALDHDNHQLNLSIEPNMMLASDAGREAKTLSGGEKSFSTICLLLSIWEAIASPIRCLDEFDVFMDSVNRNESIRLVIENARRSVGRQFILITPQSMSSIEQKDDVTIYKMPDPERGQQTLPFSQAR